MKKERCGAKTEVYSRVVGYYRPIAQWNKGKRAEFSDRLEFVMPDELPPRREEKDGE